MRFLRQLARTLNSPRVAALFATAALMCLFPSIGITLFGLVSAACFFVPGIKYYREARAASKCIPTRSESLV